MNVSDLKEHNQPITKEAAMAKYYASEVAVRTVNDAVQIFGGYGYTKDFPVENFIAMLSCVRLENELQRYRSW